MNHRPRHQEQFDKPIPRFSLRADEAAAAIGISETLLETLVAEKLLPKPFAIPGHERIKLFDPEDVRNAVREWKSLANLATDGGWENVR